MFRGINVPALETKPNSPGFIGNYAPQTSGGLIAHEFTKAAALIVDNLVGSPEDKQPRTANGIPYLAPLNVQILRMSSKKELQLVPDQHEGVQDRVVVIFARPETEVPYRHVEIIRERTVTRTKQRLTQDERDLRLRLWESPLRTLRHADVEMGVQGSGWRKAHLKVSYGHEQRPSRIPLYAPGETPLSLAELEGRAPGIIEGIAGTLMRAVTATERQLTTDFQHVADLMPYSGLFTDVNDPHRKMLGVSYLFRRLYDAIPQKMQS